MAHDLVARLTLKDNLTSRMRRVTSGMNDLDRRTRTVTGGIGRLGGAINSQVKSMGGLQSGIMGVAAAYLSVTGAAKAFNATIGAAAKFEASEVAIKAIFNDDQLSSSYLKMVDKMAIDSPLLNSTEMLSSSKGLIAMTKNMDELGKTWKIIEKLQVLDPTQGTDGATFAMKEMYQGDSLSMVERFGLNKKELNRIKKLAIPQQIAEINSMLDGMGVTEKAIQAMGSTTLGYWAQIGERTEKFMRSIGNMGNSKIGAVLGDIVTKFDSIDLDAIASKIDAGIGGAIQKVFDFTKKAWEMREPILAVTKAVGTFVGVVAGIVGTVVAFSALGAAFAFLTSPIGLLAFAIIGVGAAFKAAYAHSEPFRKAIDGVVGSVKGLFKLLSGDRLGAFGDLFGAGLDIDQAMAVESFAKKLSDGFGKVKAVLSSVSKMFTGKEGAVDVLERAGFSSDQVGKIIVFGFELKKAFDKVKSYVSGIVKAFSAGSGTGILEAIGFSPEIIGVITGYIDMMKKRVGTFVAFLTQKWAEIKPSVMMLLETFATMKETAISVFTTLWAALQPLFGALDTAIMIVADIAVLAFNSIIAPAVRFVITMFQTLWVVVGPLLELVGAAIGAAFAILKVVWDTILKPVAKWLLGTFVTVFEAMDGQLATAKDSFQYLGDKISGVVDWFKTVTDAVKNFKVPNWLSKLGGGGTVSFTETTTEAKGKGKSNYHGIDYVPKNNWSADLHRGEAVLTASENKERKQGGSGNGVVVMVQKMEVRKESDIDDIADKLYRKWSAAAAGGA